jgi:hypothetical protein
MALNQITGNHFSALAASSNHSNHSNHSFQGIAGKLRLPVRSVLRHPPAPELKR